MDLGAATKIWEEAMNYGKPLSERKPEAAYGNLLEIDSLSEIRDIVGDPDSIRSQVLFCFIFFTYFSNQVNQ